MMFLTLTLTLIGGESRAEMMFLTLTLTLIGGESRAEMMFHEMFADEEGDEA